MDHEYRTGNGFDVHQFEPHTGASTGVMLCGVIVPHSHQLKGHSDADVSMHAITDALFGAACAGDIGDHFPPSDPQWKGKPSSIFLQKARDVIIEMGGLITHIDVTIICESPKIGPHRDRMRDNLADILVMDSSRISVKATTSERLGFTGRKEGIAAIANATVRMAY